jgi:hypothetical protein
LFNLGDPCKRALPKGPLFSTTQSYAPYAASVLQYKSSYCHSFTTACCYEGHRIIFQNNAFHHSHRNHFPPLVSKYYFSPFKLLHCNTPLSEGRTGEASETSTGVAPSPRPLHPYQIPLCALHPSQICTLFSLLWHHFLFLTVVITANACYFSSLQK